MNGLKLLDLVMVGIGLALTIIAAYYLESQDPSIVRFLTLRVRVYNFLFLLAFFTAAHFFFSIKDLYQSRRLSPQVNETTDIITSVTWISAFLACSRLIFQLSIVTFAFVGAFWVVTAVLVIATRLLMRWGLRRIRVRGRNLRNVLIVGTNLRATAFADHIQQNPHLGCRLAGFVDEEWPGIDNVRAAGRRVVASLQELPAYLRGTPVDEVVIALPIGSFYDFVDETIDACVEQGILVRYIADLFVRPHVSYSLHSLDSHTLVTFYKGPGDAALLTVKRAIDVAGAGLIVVMLLPVLTLIAVVLWLTEGRPILFRQVRLGLNKRPFQMYKFRTMVTDAEEQFEQLRHLNEVLGPVFKIAADPRITPVGRILRQFSLDELPQLFNVLKGEMSLVGPRPLPVRDYQGFVKDWHRRRFSVRPGLTCLWQVNGRSRIAFEKWMELDMQYIDEWSIWLDFKILARTIPAVLRGEGAT